MAPSIRVVLLGIVAVLAFDVAASLAARAFGFPYARASLGSLALYLAIGYCVARVALRAPVQQAAIAAGLAGLADASVGWAISQALGPGRAPAGVTITPARWVTTAVMVAALATGLGALGGVAGRRSPPTDAAAV